jgi:hypothetical protein
VAARSSLSLLPKHQLNASAKETVHLMRGTTLLGMRYAVANFGHLLTENLLPMVKVALTLDPTFSLHASRFLLLDDCADPGDFDLLWGYPATSANCLDKYRQLVQAFDPTATVATLDEISVANDTNLLCFERAIFGVGGKSGLFDTNHYNRPRH